MNKSCKIKHSLSHPLHMVASVGALALLLMVLTGCQQVQPGETNRKISTAWPLFDTDKSEGQTPEGGRWQKEKGDAVCWLISWEKERTYDKDGFLISRKEKDLVIPILSGSELEETKDVYMKKGSVLLFPYYTRKVKTAAPTTK